MLDNPAGAADLGRRAPERIVERYSWRAGSVELAQYFHGVLERGSAVGASAIPRVG
jgi:hypothetical protein